MRVVPTYDRSGLIKRSIDTLREKLIEESIVVALVCLVFPLARRSALVAIITLPIAILLSFLPMLWLGLTSNIMSLGGIAIAIGAMVDAAIIMVENAHKAWNFSAKSRGANRTTRSASTAIIGAAKTVGRPLFFSLLVITVSFIPVFSLTAQEGRLFKPLAYTKTFSMFFAALLGVTLVPVLMTLLIRGKITPEIRNPVNRLLIWIYQPLVNFVLHFRWLTLAVAVVLLGVTVIPFRHLGSEFMPPLNEGTLLYMPTAVPGMAVGEATRILQIQDRQLTQDSRSGTGVWQGRASPRLPPIPHPLSMFETVVSLKPPDQWRPGMTWDKIVAEMNANIKTPGMANIFWMPIQTRTEMLTTGFRSVLGIKVFGPDLAGIQDVAVQIEKGPDGFSEHAQRVRRAHHGRIFSRFHREPRGCRPLWVGRQRRERRDRKCHRRQDDHDHRGRPGTLPGQRALRAGFSGRPRCSQAGAGLHADRRAGADFHAGGHSVQDRAAVHPRRERPTRRLRVHRPDDQ